MFTVVSYKLSLPVKVYSFTNVYLNSEVGIVLAKLKSDKRNREVTVIGQYKTLETAHKVKKQIEMREVA